MYQYNELDRSVVLERVEQFRDQVRRRLKGELSEEEFKPLRLRNGLYLQLHAYMMRIAIPYGVFSSSQLEALANIAEKYDRGYGHFTTRQNIQFNWLALVDAPKILEELAAVDMHAIQTSGNCIRNITSDPLAGVAADEWLDPRPLCELLRQWSTDHPEFAHLPRKFKFAVSGASQDRALLKGHDLGLQLRLGNGGELLSDVWVGGGQGRTPRIAQLIYRNLPLQELLPAIEAIMRVYNLYGRRDNKYKARIKILVGDLGLDEFREQVDAVRKQVTDREQGNSPGIETHLRAIAERFSLPDDLSGPTKSATSGTARVSADVEADVGSAIFTDNQSDTQSACNGPAGSVESQAFTHWKSRNLLPHRKAGFAIVAVSLKPQGGIPGDIDAGQMRILADLARRFSASELRATHRQNLLLPHVPEEKLAELWRELVAADLAEDNFNQASDIIACPGLDYCSLATARSIPVAQQLSTRLRNQERQTDLTGVTVNVSGCINACAHHHVASIGVLGLDRGGTENYQLTLGGRADGDMKLGQRLGPGVSADELPVAVDRVISLYRKKRHHGDETFDEVFERVGLEPFKQVVYANAESN